MKPKGDPKKETKEGKYIVYGDCANCHTRNRLEIEKGIKVSEVARPNCGCNTLSICW